jgi:hypothetical protein
MKFYTVATNSQGYFKSLKESAKRNNINLTVLGFNQKWEGFIWKFKMMKDAIKNLPDDEIVIFMDAFDVIILSNEKEIHDKFVSYGVDMLIGGEKKPNNIIHKFVYNQVFKDGKFKKCKFGSCFLNSGLYIAYVRVLKKILNNICIKNDCNDPTLDDQRIISQTIKENKFNIKIDNESTIFMNTWGDWSNKSIGVVDNELDTNNNNFYIVKNRIVNKSNKNKPCFLHGPGNANLNKIMRYLNYPEAKHRKSLSKTISPYIQYFLIDSFFLVILTIFTYYVLSKNLCKNAVCFKMIPWSIVWSGLIVVLWFILKVVWFNYILNE